MKLAEAKRKIEQLDHKLKSLRAALKSCSRQKVSEIFNDINQLLVERFNLSSQVLRTEVETTLGGSTLADIAATIAVLETRITILSELENRTDLDAEQLEIVFKNITLFRETKDSLDLQYQRCLWDTELV